MNDLISDWVIIEHSDRIYVVKNETGLKDAVMRYESTRYPYQPFASWLEERGFTLLDALPFAISEEPK